MSPEMTRPWDTTLRFMWCRRRARPLGGLVFFVCLLPFSAIESAETGPSYAAQYFLSRPDPFVDAYTEGRDTRPRRRTIKSVTKQRDSHCFLILALFLCLRLALLRCHPRGGAQVQGKKGIYALSMTSSHPNILFG